MNKQRVDFPVGENACQGKRGTPRGRLVKLLENSNKEAWNLIHMSCCEERLKLLEKINELRADYLLANDVIVPPCKVGQTVWGKRGCFISHPTKWENPNSLIPCEVIVIKESKKGKYILLKPLLIETYGMRKANEWFPFSAIGKTVFLSKEEAEAKLKEGVQG